VTDLLTGTRPGAAGPAGRHPALVVAVQVGRKAARSGLLWGVVFAFYVIVQTLAFTSAYPTQAARDQMARAYGTNIGLNALIGPARAINTVAGYSSWRLLGILSILGSIWGLLTATRLLRGDEESGRYELLLAGQTTLRRAGAQALGGLGAGLLTLFLLTAVGAILTGRAAGVGFTVGQCLYFSVALVAGAATFLAVGALASQLASTRRRAAATAGMAFGISYALRMVADSDRALHWLVWLSPLGWIEESRPLTGPHPLALLPVALLVLVAGVIAVHLAGTRDLGASTFPVRDTAVPHLALTSTPAGLAIRLMRPAAIGWLFAVTAFCVLLGTVAESSTKDVIGDKAVRQALGKLGGHGSLVGAYLGLTFILIALMIAMVAAGQVAAIRAEEADGHLENLVVRPVSRTSWFTGRLALSALLILGAGIVSGIAAWAGAASQHSGVRFSSLLGAGLNVVPPSVLLLGIGALMLGVWPRRTTAVVYGYLAWSFLVEFTGVIVHASHWIMDTSVFFHMVPAPASSPNWTTAAVMVGLAAAAASVGGIAITRRDVLGA
jgi:ABC-2 type transport system permease protein